MARADITVDLVNVEPVRELVKRLTLLAATFDGNAAWNGAGLYAGLVDILRDFAAATAPPETTAHPGGGNNVPA